MTRSGVLTLLFLSGSLCAPGQGGFIVNLDDHQGGFAAGGRSVKEVSDGYLVFGEQVSADPLGFTHCVIYKLDLTGAYVWRKELQLGSVNDFNYGIYDPVYPLDTGGFVSSVVSFGGPQRDVHLYWFNTDGDTVRTYRSLYYPPEDSINYASQQVRTNADGGYLCGGTFEHQDMGNTLTDALLVKISATGDTLWTRHFHSTGDQLLGYGVAECQPGGFALSGARHGNGGMNPCFVIRTDESGNELWRQFFGGRPGDFGNDQAVVRALSDGAIVTYSNYRDNNWPLWVQQLMLTKWNANGDIVWQKKSVLGGYDVSGDFEVLQDGSFITCGALWGYANLTKFSSEGDSLWSRNYYVTTHPHYAYDVESTSDGGFIATGEAEQGAQDPHPGEEVIWVLKTDSFGCVVPGCQNVGVQEYALNLQDLLHVSPNPASDQFSFSLALPEGTSVQGQMRAQLLDATGKLVLQQAVQQNLNVLSARMNVSALPAGTYYLHLRDAKRWLAGGKVVVQ